MASEPTIEESTPTLSFQEKWASLALIGCSKYSASNLGRVRYEIFKRPLKSQQDPAGYFQLNLINDEGNPAHHPVQRLVAFAFLGLPPDPKMTVDHINRKPWDNRLVNLRWATRKEQAENRVYSRRREGRSVDQLAVDGTFIRTWGTQWEIAQLFSISSACKKGHKCLGYYWRFHEEIIPGEEWKAISNPILNGYQISSHGRVKSPHGRTARGSLTGGKYRTFGKSKKLFTIHIEVYKAFHGPVPEGKLVNHKDGHKQNNHKDNLEAATSSENAKHAHDMGLIKTRKPIVQFDLAGNFMKFYISIREASKAVDLSYAIIRNAAIGRRAKPTGYHWRFLDTFPEEIQQIYRNTLVIPEASGILSSGVPSSSEISSPIPPALQTTEPIPTA